MSELLTFLCFKPEKLKLRLDPQKKLSQNGKEMEVDRFSIGNLTGIQMAIDGLKIQSRGAFQDFIEKDVVTLECVERVPAVKANFSDMLKFKITVEDLSSNPNAF